MILLLTEKREVEVTAEDNASGKASKESGSTVTSTKKKVNSTNAPGQKSKLIFF